MGAQWSQFFPPNPSFTDTDVPPLDGKVFIVTGGASGIGFEVVKKLYANNARVYIAGRSADKAQKAIETINSSTASSTGSIEFLYLALDDLSTIKDSVEVFMSKETKLHVLWNNAGVSQPPSGAVSKQGIELQLATNCLGPFLLTKLLLPLLEATAASEPAQPGTVRVVWSASQMVELAAPKDGIIMSELTDPPADKARNYSNSKTGNLFLATELARRAKVVVSVAQNPGAVNTNLFRHTPLLPYLAWPLLYKAELAAFTTLYCGLSHDITLEKNGCYVVPWGRISDSLRPDLVQATKRKEEGGTGRALEFWEFCEAETRDHA